MSDARPILEETASRLFLEMATGEALARAEDGAWSDALWSGLEHAGLAQAARTEDRGGAGADLEDQAVALWWQGYRCLPAPLAETYLAETLLAAAGLPQIDGPATIAPVFGSEALELERERGRWTLSGTSRRIPWARHARAIVALARHEGAGATVVVRGKLRPLQEGASYDGEPRDTVHFDRFPLEAADVAVGEGLSFDELHMRGALYRSVQMAGALRRLLDLTLDYSTQRVQFGRPLSKFQAVQQMISVLATHATAATVAANAAVHAAMHSAAEFEIAAAKIRIGEAVGVSTQIAHQVQGTMGFTYEYPLHYVSRRLWSWRDEFGNENAWADRLGSLAAARGREGLWPLVTSRADVLSAG